MKVLLLILLLQHFATSAAAQQKRITFDWSDAALAGSLVADEVSSHYAFKRGAVEAGAIKHTGVRIGAKVLWFGLIKVWDYHHPQQRKQTRWIKLGAACAFGFIAIHNSRVKR